jgi:hypothetical protein
MRSGPIIALLSLSLPGAAIAGCLGPTEIVLEVRTNVPCTNEASWRGVAISVGQPGVDVESRSPVLTTSACSATGEVGTLAVVPTGRRDAQVGIRVVAGLARNPEDCAAAGYEGCIVARRTLAYLPHQSQHLLIDLTSDCIGNGCDLNHTCVDGSCSDTVTATPPLGPDGSIAGGPTVRCGDDGTRCPANDPKNVCCVTFDFTAGTGKGKCVAAASCPSSSATLYCDDARDCEPGDAADPGICCVTTVGDNGAAPITNATCQPASTCRQDVGAEIVSLCQERQVCPRSSHNCHPAGGAAPGYFLCNTLP